MSSNIQAVLFDRYKWTAIEARNWLKSNHYTPIKRVHKTDNNLRYRLKNPTRNSKYITKHLHGGITLIILTS